MKIRKQEDVKDCGIFVIQGLHHFYYKKWLNINELKYLANYDRDGISISSFIDLAKEAKINIEAYKASWNEFLDNSFKFPIITMIEINGLLHYICIEEITKNQIIINDSVNGRRIMQLENFKLMFTGIILLSSKANDKPINSKLITKDKITFLTKPSLVILSLIIGCALPLLHYCLSFINKAIFSYIEIKNLNFATQNIILFVWISIVTILLTWINDLCISKIKNLFQKNIKQEFSNKLNKIDQSQLRKINRNEVLIRYNLIEIMSGFLANKYFLLSNFVVSLSLACSLFLSIDQTTILFIFLFCLVRILISVIIDFKIKQLNQLILKNTIEEINDISFLANNQSNYDSYIWNQERIMNFNNCLLVNNNFHKKMDKFLSFKKLLNSVFVLITNFIIIYFFIQYSKEPISHLFFIISVQGLINNPIVLVQGFLTNKSINEIFKSKICFILNAPQNDIICSNIIDKTINKIGIKNLTISYGSKEIIQNLNLNIENNCKIVGKNGAGKSSLIKTLAGNFIQYKNRVFFNNESLNKISNYWLESNVFYIDNSFNFPNVDLYTYLFLNIDKKIVDILLNDAKFKEILNTLNLSIFSNLNHSEDKLSLGQKQLIKVLPLIIRKYKIILLDEAFEFISWKLFKKLREIIIHFQNEALIIETSHSQRFIDKKSPIITICQP
ncbi:cysteine peptidase family C39 domain-containing protein [Mycoplasma enhydrae]|uniref:Mbov_0121 family peptidase domain-containing ABC transporter n=1 Tax=Mycoplasma enhydrae TaxID=2499220 RepID=UPI0021E859C6|nr:cysteine peptidase family C39 domain-containing protein [Mycoplasma enhydrae]MCV3753528.1 cysteine peptidase family C39 domain-containing protein [Mycoplasma enhydrae]